MPDKRPDRIREMFDRITPTYDLLNRVFSLDTDRRWRRAAAAEIPAGARVLDLCCGTGDLALAAAREGRSVVGADFSAAMLRRAAAKLRSRRPAPPVRLVRADALHLPFRDGSFDACTIGWGLRNLVRPELGLREIVRVLRPGGRALILEFSRPRTPFTRAFHGMFLTRVMRAVGDAVSASRAYGYLADSVSEWFDADALAALMGDCGLVEVRARPLSGGICHLHTGRRPAAPDV
jgi:demethylmenaquinone methyltransferase/2-methoxy-6-polyprenyl-1,4-benzoquinol methylase